ncbi:HNH endonuclease family protein [Rhodococcus rhodochrous]|uniref:HNH endonuclease family protein n=1 Tax=Rhodococcus rhodochrous TaxID=1829 RepID=UPI00226CF9C3|nr:HNH endonuclease family protein [Rhodococcus rhodochrous]
MRRVLVKANTRGYGRTFIEVLQEAQTAEEEGRPIAAAIVAALNGTGSARWWPTDAEITESFTTRRFYDGVLSRGRLRLLLSEIDRTLRAENMKTEQGQFDYDVLQIEHIMPRNWAANWPVDASDDAERIATQQHRRQHVDRIGNLTLITGSFNGSLSDSAWEVKRPALLQQSKLQLNSRIAATEIWDEDAITARAKELADITNGIWRSADAFAHP